MKTLILYLNGFWMIWLGLTCSRAVAQQSQPVSLRPQVDKRVELMSILARLANYEEYSQQTYPAYVADIEHHFSPYKNHTAVVYMRDLRARRQIGYDAVMSYAIQLGSSPDLQPIVAFEDHLPDSRWTVDDANQLTSLVKQFYKDAHCDEFFQQQTKRYQSAEIRFAEVIHQIDLPWFQRYYGQTPTQAFRLVIGLGNGGGNYGPHLRMKDDSQMVYAIMGTWSTDSTGMAQYRSADYLPTVIHEFNHSFVNPLIDQCAPELAAYADTIYARVQEPMNQQAYGSGRTMLYESLVRASVVMYVQEHNPDGQSALEQVRDEQHHAFVWTDTLTGLLRQYTAHRARYPTLQSFMPEHTAFYQWLAPRIDSLLEAYTQQCPRVVAVEPFGNNSRPVNASTQEIRIRFDKPMNAKKYGIQLGEGGKEQMPIRQVIGLSDDTYAFRMSVNLKPKQTYSFRLMSGGFRTIDGYRSEAYTVSFTTSP